MVLIVLALSASAGNRLILPEGVYYHRFVSNAAGPEAVWINPAALGQSKVLCTEYLGEYFEGKFLNSWGAVVSGDGLGISYRHLENIGGNPYNEYTFALGAELNRDTYWGASYKYIKTAAPVFNKRHFWNVGLLINSTPNLALGMTFSNLNRGKLDNRRSDFEQIYSLTYKLPQYRVSFSADMSLSSGQSLKGAEWNYGLEYDAARGVKLFGVIDHSGNYQLGLKINFEKYFVGDQSRHNSGSHQTANTAYIGFMGQSQGPAF